ncbi:MAG: gamma carbonic anhydrase family protein [Planctomycetia bacterium]|nr:gamma carbonic anhydrase family protein [Planctomycetia bacterium]
MSDIPQLRPELIDPTAFIAPGTVVLGDVTVGEQSSVWFLAVLRGDVAPIQIGRRTNIQDGAILHADAGFPCVLGDDVTVGHRAIVHGCRVEDRVLIGMGAVVMNGAVVGHDSIVAVGAVVLEGMQIPPGSLVAGVPARIKRKLEDKDRERIAHAAAHYVENARRYQGETK